MKILLVSYYAEAHLPSSSAQNTRLLAESLAAEGHEVRIVCAAVKEATAEVDGYRIDKLPIVSPTWKSPWLGTWRGDARLREIAQNDFASWRPDVVLIGAWAFLSEFALAAAREGIPTVQVVHDYSLICLRQWLLDAAGELCSGPTSEGKCRECIASSFGPRGWLRNRLLSLPVVPALARTIWGEDTVGNHHAPTAVGEAWRHMAAYRRAITLFVAQAPSVIDVLATAGVEADRCRLLPQFIGDEKLERYPRPQEAESEHRRPVRIVYVGRWSREKGPDLLLEAFANVESAVELELWILSGNADATAIEAELRAVARDSPRRIRVITDARGAEVSKRLAECDLCVVPSRCRELASRVVLEAFAQSVPVIASSTVGNGYLIDDGVNGRIFPVGDRDALQRCIEEAVADPAVIREWARNLPQPIRREEWLSRVREILEEAISITA